MFNRRAPNRLLDLAELERPDYRRVLDRFDRLLAREEVSYLHPSKRWEYPWALERAELAPSSRVLDAGCGGSIFPIYLAASGQRTTACDLTLPGRLDRLHEVQVDYLEADLTALPLADSCFDAVFCISVIEHLEKNWALKVVSELHRVLCPGGRLLLTTDFYQDAEAPIRYQGPGRQFRVDWHIFDEQRLRELLAQAAGLEVEGAMDLTADWETIRPQMTHFHGYPYTSAGVALRKV